MIQAVCIPAQEKEPLPVSVALPTTISAAANFAFTLEPLLPGLCKNLDESGPDFFWLRNATAFTAHLPLYAVNPATAAVFTGIEAASTGLLWLSVYPLRGNWYLAGPATLLQSQVGGMYANYEVYKQSRIAAGDEYTDGWNYYSYADLVKAQFSWDTIKRPIVWIPAALSLTAGIVTIPSDNAIWNTGEAYLGNWRTGSIVGGLLIAAANIANYSMVGIGEETFYRGVLYEELSSAVGVSWAKVIDAAVLFPLIHVPQYILSGNSLSQILIMCGFISASTVVFDFAYDIGGLPLSSTVHMWLDFFYYTAMGFQVFGAPLGANTGNNQTSAAELRITPRTFSLRIAW